MDSEIEDQIIEINTKVNRLVDIENGIEKLVNAKPEVYQMNSSDRDIFLREIRSFENGLSETLKKVFFESQQDFKSERIRLTTANQNTYNEAIAKIQTILIDFQNATDSCKGLDEVCRKAVSDSTNIYPFINAFKNEINTTVKETLQKQTKANEQAAIKLGNTAVEVRGIMKRCVHINYAIPSMLFPLIALVFGFLCHGVLMNMNCENVFDQFYSERYEKEIAEPLKAAEKEASDYLKQQKKEADKYLSETKKQADEDLKNRKAEAKKYLEDQMTEARNKAQEEYDRRMELYSQQVQTEVDKKLKKQTKNSTEVK